MKIILIFNPKSGTAKNAPEKYLDNICELLKKSTNDKYDLEVINIFDDKIDSDRINNEADNIKAVLISGGDGTISSSLKIVVENKIPLGIIPMGTYNNFAGDNNIPQNIHDAIKTISEFNTTNIDVGEVNGIYFINNSSIGLYTFSVRIRERTRRRYSLNKFMAMILAMIRIFYFFPLLLIEIVFESKIVKRKTPFVFIGNNKYKFDLLNLGGRETLNEGNLFLYYSKCKNRFCLIKIGIKALLDKLKEETNFIVSKEKEFKINSKKKSIHVAADGEIYKLRPPLKYKIHPESVKLIVSKK